MAEGGLDGFSGIQEIDDAAGHYFRLGAFGLLRFQPSLGGNEGDFTGSISKADTSANSSARPSADKLFAANAQGTGKFTVTAPEDYRISPSDVVEVSVFGVADLTRTVQVSTNGAISLPLIKTVQAAGKTASELELIIAAKLEATYLQSPQVSVFVKEYTSQRITVDGAVNKPGIFPTTGQLSLLQSIALAGALTMWPTRQGFLFSEPLETSAWPPDLT